jgi:hypothetical protein
VVKKGCALVACFFAMSLMHCFAQVMPSSLCSKQLAYADTLVLDTLSIIPSSLQLKGISSQYYKLINTNTIVFIKQPEPKLDSIHVAYRRIQFDLAKRYQHKNYDSVSQNFGTFYNARSSSENASDKFVDYGDIDYGGSLSRGLSFGNAQDVVLNSQFNLQMAGMVADSIELRAAITDNNVPFQPQGNTQRLQEFDRVYFNLSKRNANLVLGDHELLRPQGYFMQFYKRVQGAYFTNQQQHGKRFSHTYGLGASLAKGKFVRQTVAVQEGNQGPYKLIGPNGETFFIILANTERVIVDGIVLQRGEEFDYTMDYNTGEVYFMPRCMMNKDRRVIIEYEFNDRNYLNSLVYTTQTINYGKHWQFNANMYSNQDARNQQFQQVLDDKQKMILSAVGDNIAGAYSIMAVRDSSLGAKVFYTLRDTTVQGTLYDSIFTYAVPGTPDAYSVSFSFVGSGKGSYVIERSTANGRVYRWVAPQNSVPQGDYQPYTLIVSPKRLQMYTAGGRYTVDSSTNIGLEVAISNNDPNLFSKIDNEKHLGVATKFSAEHSRIVGKKKHVLLGTKLNYEFVESRFKPLERFRSAEFTRDWTLEFEPAVSNEHLTQLALQLRNGTARTLCYELNSFERSGRFSGIRQSFSFSDARRNIKYSVGNSYTTTRASDAEGNFMRPYLTLELKVPQLRDLIIGTKCSLERSVSVFTQSQLLNPLSFAFNVAQVYIQTSASSDNKFTASYFVREDQLPTAVQLKAATLSHNFSAAFDIASIKRQTLRANVGYRELLVHDTQLYRNKADRTMLGRVEHSAQLLRGALTTNMLYEFGSGQELRREITYVEVPVGKGDFAWIDYNADKVQQLNEFEFAQFPDQRRFIRVFTPSNQYAKVNYSTANVSINCNPKQLWTQEGLSGIRKFINRWTNVASAQLSTRSIASADSRQLLPWYVPATDTMLLAQNNTFSNNLYFNRFSQVWGADYQWQLTSNSNLMTYGVDSRGGMENTVRMRANFTRQLAFLLVMRAGSKKFDSKFLEGRSYNFDFKGIEPSISILSNKQKNRWQVSGRYDTKQNALNLGGEASQQKSLSTQFRHAMANAGNIEIKGTVTKIQYNSLPNTSVAFIMLDGLLPGNNFIWNCTIDRRLGKGFEIGVSYDGRKAGASQVVHTGRATARAIF